MFWNILRKDFNWKFQTNMFDENLGILNYLDHISVKL